jgi:DNA-binding MarR family transcriptional regulator
MSTDDRALREKLDELQREMRLMSSFDSLFSHAVSECVGMHQTDIETMDLLNTLGPMTAGELSARTGLSSGATTRLIDRLERAGFVRRCADATDRRRVIIEPLPENLGELAALFQPLAQEMDDMCAGFTPEELTVIIKFLRGSNTVTAKANARLRAQAARPEET